MIAKKKMNVNTLLWNELKHEVETNRYNEEMYIDR